MLIISGILTEQLLTVSEYCWILWFALWSCAAPKNASTCENCQLSLSFFSLFFSKLHRLLLRLLAHSSRPIIACFRLSGPIHVSLWARGWKHTGNSFLVIWKIYGWTSRNMQEKGPDVWRFERCVSSTLWTCEGRSWKMFWLSSRSNLVSGPHRARKKRV